MPKYEPPREDGLKGYVLEISDWARRYKRTVYAKDATSARNTYGRPRPGFYVVSVKRKPVEEDES